MTDGIIDSLNVSTFITDAREIGVSAQIKALQSQIEALEIALNEVCDLYNSLASKYNTCTKIVDVARQIVNSPNKDSLTRTHIANALVADYPEIGTMHNFFIVSSLWDKMCADMKSGYLVRVVKLFRETFPGMGLVAAKDMVTHIFNLGSFGGFGPYTNVVVPTHCPFKLIS